MMTAGCSPSGHDLYGQAHDVYSSMREEVADLQLYVFDGEWDLGGWGVIPEECGSSGYRFAFSRTTPLDDGWWLPQETTEAKADAIMRWLDEHGWSDIRLLTYSGGVASVNIEASNPAAHVEDLLVTLTPGTANDIVHLKVTGSCESGSQAELRALMFPDGVSDLNAPERAHPSVLPPFGLPAPSPTPTPTPES